MKHCPGCKTDKPFSEYHRRVKAKDGFSSYCKPCKSEMDKIYRQKNKDALTLTKKDYHEKNKEYYNKKARLDYVKNAEAYKLRAKKWKEQNRERHNANCMERHVLKMQRKPKWDEELTDFVFSEAYDMAKRKEALTGIKHEVDHIVPLRGKTVSGLHVWSNFAVIPASENCSKAARRWPNMWKRA
jgi:hypothetical protein